MTPNSATSRSCGAQKQSVPPERLARKEGRPDHAGRPSLFPPLVFEKQLVRQPEEAFVVLFLFEEVRDESH